MSPWIVAAGLLILALVPCGYVCLRTSTMERVIGLQLSGLITTLILLALAIASHRTLYLDISLSMAVMSLAYGLVFARFLERWL